MYRCYWSLNSSYVSLFIFIMVTAEYLFAFVETKQFVGWSFKKANIHISVASKWKLLWDLFVVGDELLGLNKEHTSCWAICVSSLCRLLTQVGTWNCNRGENMIRVCYDLAEDSQLFKTVCSACFFVMKISRGAAWNQHFFVYFSLITFCIQWKKK